jgi:hypothetical protein
VSTKCRTCGVAYMKEYNIRNPTNMRRGNLARRGLTLEQWEIMLSEQGGRCAICGTDKPGGIGEKLNVDHDHGTGAVRGLLCHLCNRMLGHAKDDVRILEAAIAYLGEFRTRHS